MRRIGAASDGRVHFKVSPSLQTLLGKAMYETDGTLFSHWWDLSEAHARELAARDSELARTALAEAEQGGESARTPESGVFHHFSFAAVGKVDAEGQLANRDWFYTLPQTVYDRYAELVRERLCRLADDLFSA